MSMYKKYPIAQYFREGLGYGSSVRLKKPFGIGNITVGTKGKVVGYDRFIDPIVTFESEPNDEYVVEAEKLEVLKRIKPESRQTRIMVPPEEAPDLC